MTISVTIPNTTPRRIKIRNPLPVLPDNLPVLDSPSQGDQVVEITCQTLNYANYDEYLASDVWQIKRERIIARDGKRCRLCNSTKILHVHHRCYSTKWGEEPDDDLITLCRKCHYIFHNNGASKQITKNHVIKIKNNKNRANIRINKKPSIPKLLNKLIRILWQNGLLPLDCRVKFKDAVKIICLNTNQQFPKGIKYKQIQIASAYIKGEGIIRKFKELTYV